VRKFVITLSMLMMLTGPARAEPLSRRVFTDAVAAAATAAMPSARVTVTGDLQLEIRGNDSGTHAFDLTSTYQRYLGDPAHLHQVIHQYIKACAEIMRLDDAKIDRTHIVAVMKSQQWLDGTRQRSREAPQLLADPYNSELVVVYAEDRPNSMRFLTTRDDVGDRAKLRDLALDNLQRLVPKVTIRGGPDGLWLFEAGGDYEASLLLADRLWTGGQIKVDGEVVAAVPAKDALIVTGSHNHAGLARLRALAAELARGPYSLTSDLLVYRDGRFVRFDGK